MKLILSKTKDFKHTTTFIADSFFKKTDYNDAGLLFGNAFESAGVISQSETLFFEINTNGDLLDIKRDLKNHCCENVFFIKYSNIVFRCSRLFVPGGRLICFCTCIGENVIT